MKTSQALKDLANQISELSYRDMVAFVDGVHDHIRYTSGGGRSEGVLKWCDDAIKEEVEAPGLEPRPPRPVSQYETPPAPVSVPYPQVEVV